MDFHTQAIHITPIQGKSLERCKPGCVYFIVKNTLKKSVLVNFTAQIIDEFSKKKLSVFDCDKPNVVLERPQKTAVLCLYFKFCLKVLIGLCGDSQPDLKLLCSPLVFGAEQSGVLSVCIDHPEFDNSLKLSVQTTDLYSLSLREIEIFKSLSKMFF